MTDLEALGARVDHLEMRFAHQDHVIDELNNTITEQWKHIDALTRRLVALGDRVQEAAVNAGSSAPEPPPPHY